MFDVDSPISTEPLMLDVGVSLKASIVSVSMLPVPVPPFPWFTVLLITPLCNHVSVILTKPDSLGPLVPDVA